MLMHGRRRRRAGRRAARHATHGSGATKDGKDDTKEEDEEEADARSMGMRAPEAGASQGESQPRSGGRRRRTGGVAKVEGVGGSVDSGFWEAGGGGESWGQRPGSAAEGGGLGG
jgi:hypothetical protein